MASTFFLAPTANFTQTTLNGSINDNTNTITLTNVAGFQAPGYAVIDRTDSSGVSTPSAREVISYTGISGSNLTGVTRGADDSTARAHSDGAVVETVPTVGMWNNLLTIVSSGFDSNGYLRALNSPVSIAKLHGDGIMGNVTVTSLLNVAGASVVGVGLFPAFQFIGSLSGPTTNPQAPLSMPKVGTWSWFSLITRTVASGASAIVDVNVNGTSIFEAGTRPTIAGGGTFVSTASINTKNFKAGDRLTWDMDTGGGLGLHIADITIQGGAV